MKTIICDLNKNENVFDLLPDEITTVNVILEAVEHKDDEECDRFSEETKKIVNKLDKIYSCNDDFFNTKTNKVMNNKDILQQYNIKIIPYKR